MWSAGSFFWGLCMMTTAEPVSATASAMPGSRCRPQTSLITQAPSRAALRATAALLVSMEIGASRSARASSAGTTRLSSSSSGTGTCPGLVDSPPTSTMAAPSATMARARATAAPRSEWRPPSENESGVTLRMPMSWGAVFSALKNVSRWRTRRSMPMSVGYRLFAASATAICPARAEATPCSGADGGQDARPGARPLMERRPVVFLVGRVNAVVVERKANQQAVQIEFALERADDRNRPAAADQRRRLFPFDLQGATGDPQRLVLD